MIEALITTIISGLMLGALYCLVAVGLTIIWGTLEIYNFAHGAFVAMGAYFVWGLIYNEIGFLLSVPIALLLIFVVGVVIYVLVIKQVADNLMIVVICTMMIAIFVENTILLVYPQGALIKRLPAILDVVYRVGFITIPGTELVYTITAIVILGSLWMFLKKTRLGLAIRAVNQDKDAALLMGISVSNVSMFIVGLAGVLAGIAGIFIGSKEIMIPTMGSWPMWKASIICLFGGLGDIKGTAIAAFMISEIEVLTTLLLGTTWATPVLFIFLMVFLMFRPTGIAGD